ncbi:DUF1176 domain-containing protein [Allosphingosinicella flava]|uniref:DUF1176 domain-containing protein n=1 Tax=Allosphingosinicella flava TaxID=2771430 RepID=A0A7T2GJJ7_9SPHN|nr:DUF1176 domain-containing protein [Sphingosinicella flava]QPQ55011.1 DUF1176 domain-containing protein [Sphingosinicella flava]
MILALLALGMTPQPGEVKTFGDWMAGCDNGRACRAVALLDENGSSDWTIAIDRGAGLSDLPTVNYRENDLPETCTHYDIYIDGVKQPLDLASACPDGKTIKLREIAHDYGPYDPNLPAILKGSLMEYRLEDGRVAARVSLKGSAAALRYMDEQQGRIGTATALTETGSAEQAPLPALPEIAAVAPTRPAPPARLNKAQIVKWQKQAQCDLAGRMEGAESHRLDDRTSLILAPCWLAAYNAGSLALIARKADGSDAAPAPIARDLGADGTASKAAPVIAGAEWSKASNLLSSYYKGRGIGDCGIRQIWAWDGQAFQLASAAKMDECRGSGDFIPVWRAEVVRTGSSQ